ncbi:uncharacterized protein LOC109597589 [Aethina tumida]|uniref:uncharacterized protein LOC109597589 n=1 Tax=Aethina tumida TaxID=116153 RepID=UPI00096AE209|nr:uncharacterized protein LOC109597589 [Aethina tumida]
MDGVSRRKTQIITILFMCAGLLYNLWVATCCEECSVTAEEKYCLNEQLGYTSNEDHTICISNTASFLNSSEFMNYVIDEDESWDQTDPGTYVLIFNEDQMDQEDTPSSDELVDISACFKNSEQLFYKF